MRTWQFFRERSGETWRFPWLSKQLGPKPRWLSKPVEIREQGTIQLPEPKKKGMQKRSRPKQQQHQPTAPKKLKSPPPPQSPTHLQQVKPPFDLCIPKPEIPVGGRLKHFKSQWYNLTKDPKIIQMISGCPIEVLNTLPVNNSVREIKMSKSEMAIAREHIEELLRKHAIIESHREDGDFCSNVFLCPKSNGKYCMVLNLKFFNNFAHKSSFKMETLRSILDCVTKSCWMTILDLQDAFLTVPCLPKDCIYLKFVFDGKIF